MCGRLEVKSLQNCPLRISAEGKRSEIFAPPHQARVTAAAKRPTPTMTGYFGISVQRGGWGMRAPTGNDAQDYDREFLFGRELVRRMGFSNQQHGDSGVLLWIWRAGEGREEVRAGGRDYLGAGVGVSWEEAKTLSG